MKYNQIIILAVLPVIFFANSSAAQGITGNWTTASSDGFTPRSSLSACVIGDKIYAIGGTDGINSGLDTLEVFNTSTNTWSTPATIGKMSRRSYFTSCVIGGMIYVIGGMPWNIDSTNNVEVFDPVKNTWYTPAVFGNYKQHGGITSNIVNGKIYVVNGGEGGDRPLYIFDPTTNIWSTPTTTGQFTPRDYATSCVLNGKIYIIGGIEKNGGVVGTLQTFDPSSNQWSTPTTTGTFTPRSELCSSVVGGRIYVFGGSDGVRGTNILEIFDPSTNSWSTPVTHGKFTSRWGLVSCVVGVESQKIYVLGGAIKDSNNNNYYLNTNEVFTIGPLNVKNHTSDVNISLFPNPTNGIITIHNASSNLQEIKVVNIIGETVMELKNLHSSDITLDLSKLIRGTYYIRFISANSVTTKMVVLQN